MVHKGAHRHGADEITSGERVSLIVWAKSSAYRQSEAYLASRLGRQRTRPGVHSSREAGVEELALDPICLSVTHDADYGEHEPFPIGAAYRPQERKAFLASFTSDAAKARAAELKSNGGDDFKEEKWAAAAAKYSASAEYIVRSQSAAKREEAADGDVESELAAPTVCMMRQPVTEAEGERASEALGLLASLWLNEAQCQLKMAEYTAAQQCCAKVIALEADGQLSVGQYAKARYRRALARMEQDEFEEAKADLVAAGKLEPSNKAVRIKLEECAEQRREQKEREKLVYRRALGGGGTTGTAGEQAAQQPQQPTPAPEEVEEEFDAFSFCEVGPLEVVD